MRSDDLKRRDKDLDPVWLAEDFRRTHRMKWHHRQPMRGILAFLALVFGTVLSLMGLSQK